MLTKTASLLRDANPPSHIGYPCADEKSIVERWHIRSVRNTQWRGSRACDISIRREMIERYLEAESLISRL